MKRRFGTLWFGVSTAVLLGVPGASNAQDPDADGLRKLEEALARELGQREAPRPVTGSRGASTASARGLGNLQNPAISANGLLLGGYSSRSSAAVEEGEGTAEGDEGGHSTTGLRVEEVELRMSAIVDPYWRADFALAASDEEIGFEEAYVSTLEIPWVTIRGGRMLANVGRHNLLHTHAFPFLTAPLPWRALLGDEGLSDAGVSADVLLPLPFFAELNGQVFRGDWKPFAGGVADDLVTPGDETAPDRRRDEDFVYVGHLETLFELGTSTTAQLGGSYVGGRNGFGEWTSIAAADLTLKWRPIESERYTSLDWTTEYVSVERRGAPEGRRASGAYTALRYQFEQRWWIQGRGALLAPPEENGASRTWRTEALIAFIPSEFSALRLQYAFERSDAAFENSAHELFLQMVVSIGSHPPH